MRGIVEECASALDHELALSHVPDHHEEDERHERDLGEFRLTLRPHLDRTEREDEDGHDHGEEREDAGQGDHMRRP